MEPTVAHQANKIHPNVGLLNAPQTRSRSFWDIMPWFVFVFFLLKVKALLHDCTHMVMCQCSIFSTVFFSILWECVFIDRALIRDKWKFRTSDFFVDHHHHLFYRKITKWSALWVGLWGVLVWGKNILMSEMTKVLYMSPLVLTHEMWIVKLRKISFLSDWVESYDKHIFTLQITLQSFL